MKIPDTNISVNIFLMYLAYLVPGYEGLKPVEYVIKEKTIKYSEEI